MYRFHSKFLFEDTQSSKCFNCSCSIPVTFGNPTKRSQNRGEKSDENNGRKKLLSLLEFREWNNKKWEKNKNSNDFLKRNKKPSQFMWKFEWTLTEYQERKHISNHIYKCHGKNAQRTCIIPSDSSTMPKSYWCVVQSWNMLTYLFAQRITLDLMYHSTNEMFAIYLWKRSGLTIV